MSAGLPRGSYCTGANRVHPSMMPALSYSEGPKSTTLSRVTRQICVVPRVLHVPNQTVSAPCLANTSRSSTPIGQ